ncbi:MULTISPECIES: hypothetical protein [unclassified Streptomyces]|uniref:hypothetical protein n=1 Tax=unclassified Streptomyces TaxID=2593676 RepID=UPI000565D50E|nr:MULTISPECIES: hypothetical protein [unclassified Streptomyces]KOV72443.1 hypothetical protein ADL02_43385 [Streptomyces sp. NRRL WC-3723]
MPDSQTSTTELVTQYSSQLASDLARNVQEQDRIRSEIDQLQGRLLALQHDHSVLATMQQALESGIPMQQAAASKGRRGAGTDHDYGLPGGSAGPRRRQNKPTLVALIRAYLAQQSEPSSAAEIAAALGEAHPDRVIKTTVVRTTLEGLVARSAAQRLKQGHSVFYAALEPTDEEKTAREGGEEQGAASGGRASSKD